MSFPFYCCEICAAATWDESKHERWHQQEGGTRWDKGRDDRFREEDYTSTDSKDGAMNESEGDLREDPLP